jgi:hypothetical protein
MQRNCRKQHRLREPQRLFRIPEAVGYLDNVVTAKTLRGWVLRKQIDIVKIGGRVTIPRSALDMLIERGHVPAVGNDTRKRGCPNRCSA